MGSARIERRPSLVARVAAALLFAAGLASCTGVLTLDDYEPASESICGKLDSCYTGAAIDGCRKHVDDRLDVAGAGADAWLKTLASEGCLDNCASARSCLDITPVCQSQPGDACTVKEECCSFTKGAADCVLGRCCLTDGQRCGSGAECCGSTCSGNTCGGVLCREEGAPCDIDAQCCSASCRNNACTLEVCRPDGFECEGPDQCCSKFCDATKHCGPPACLPESAPCAGDADCCQGLVCYALGTRSFCSPSACTPREIDCGDDTQCCTGFCDPVYRVCADGCRQAGEACEVNGQCCTGTCEGAACSTGCSRAYCDADGDCCSGKCVAHTCAPECSTEACGHTMCETGAPLRNTCPNVIPACIDEVCNIDSYCCCNAWDAFCLAELSAACQTKCQGP